MNTGKEAFIPPGNSYHGLKNQGATCYLNSVLQVLFMTKEFREAVKRKKTETECIDLHLTKLFDDLTKRTAQTHQITKNLGISRVHEQRDAAEYFEKILSHTSPEASQIFRGQLTHKNMCSKCGTETDADGPFWSLPLALIDSNSENYSVVDGIKELFKTSEVSGDNQMYCDKCDAKEDATMKCVIKHHPEVLALLLKRFEFDYRYMEYVKISRCVYFPCTLLIPEEQTYELYGFVDHFGDLRGGHYTATIKCRDGRKWYNFNDTRVTRLPDYQQFQMDDVMKSSNAYLLFYRKKTVEAGDTSQDIKEVSTNGGFQSDTSYSNEQRNVKIRKRDEDEEAEKQENKKKRIVDNQEGKPEQDFVHVDEQGVEKLVKDVKVDEESTTGASEREKASVSGKWNSDSFHGFQNDEGVGDSNISKNQGISNTSPTRHEQQREEKRDVKKDEEEMTSHQDSGNIGDDRKEQRSGQNSGLQPVCVENKGDEEVKVSIFLNKPNDEREDKTEISDKLNVSSGYFVENQGENRDGKGERQQEKGDNGCVQRRITSESHSSEGVEDKPQEQPEEEIGHKDVGVERKIKEEEKDKPIQNRKESFTRQTGSVGSRDQTQNQRAHSEQMIPPDQNKRQGNTTVEKSSKTNMRTETAAETFGVKKSRQLSDDKRKDKRKCDSKKDDMDTLSEGDCNLKSNDSTSQGAQEHSTEKVIRGEVKSDIESANESNVKKIAKESDSQGQDSQTKHESKKKRKYFRKKPTKGKKKKKRSWLLSCIRNAGSDTE